MKNLMPSKHKPVMTHCSLLLPSVCWVQQPFLAQFSQPGTRSQAALGDIQQGEVLALFLGFYLLSLASCSSLLVPETFTRTWFESSRARHTPCPVILRVVQRRSVMKVMKDGACCFLFSETWILRNHIPHGISRKLTYRRRAISFHCVFNYILLHLFFYCDTVDLWYYIGLRYTA